MAIDYFLKIDGVDGESNDSKHKGEIQIESFSWGEAQAGGGSARGGGGGAGKVQMQDFHFVMKTNKSSPKLFLACATGEHFAKASLTLRKAGNQAFEFLKITLADVLVSSFQIGATSEQSGEQFSLSFSRVEWNYVQQTGDGGSGAAVQAAFNLKTNKAV